MKKSIKHIILVLLSLSLLAGLISCNPVTSVSEDSFTIDSILTANKKDSTTDRANNIYNIETDEVIVNNIRPDNSLKDAVFLLIILAGIIICLLIVLIIMLYFKEFFKMRLHV